MERRTLDLIRKGMGYLTDDTAMRVVTIFLPPKTLTTKRVRLTKIARNGDDFRVSFGRPNFEEREFLKQCQKAKTKPKTFWFRYKRKTK